MKPRQQVADRRQDYREFCAFRGLVILTRRLRPGVVWNWHNGLPVDFEQTIPCAPRKVLRIGHQNHTKSPWWPRRVPSPLSPELEAELDAEMDW